MPKLFGTAVSGLAVVVLASGLIGCRTAATQLAGVPGLGWLDRGDEGWANYEPAPGVAKPSATTEPTSDGAASGIASTSKADSPFGSPASKVASNASNSRFDTDRYLPKKSGQSGTTEKSPPTFGSYASAYGKFSPPSKSDNKSNTNKGLAAQTGPYSVDDKADTPKFAASTPAKDFTTDSKAPSFGPALNDRIGAEPAAASAAKSPAFTANSNSRFGAAAFDKPKQPASKSTYTPPGFPTTPKLDAVSSRFGGASETTKSTLDKANRFASDSASQFDKTATNSFANGQQTFNRFSSDATATANSATARAATAVSSGTDSISKGTTQVANQFSTQAKSQPANAFGNAANVAQNQLNNATNGGQAFANPTQNSLVDSATQTFNSAASSAQSQLNTAVNSTVNNVVAGTKDYAAGYQNAAAGAVNDIKNRFGNVAPTQPPAFGNSMQNTTQNITQGVTNQVQNYAQGAVNSVEQGVVSNYEQAKAAATNYANSAMNNVGQRANEMVNSATSGAGQQPVVGAAQNLLNSANTGVNQARSTAQGYANAGQNALNNALQNVSNATAPPVQYPSTSTPNPFLNPPKVSAPSSATPPQATPTFNAPNFRPATTPPPSIQRESAPFLPGSTKSFQGATTVRKQEIELASADTSEREPLLQLAVGDRYQFPRSLR